MDLTAPSATVVVVIGLGHAMRRWRLALLVIALGSVIGIGAGATHGALDASAAASAAHDHADTCVLVGLVCALVVSTVAPLRMASRPREVGWLEPAVGTVRRRPTDSPAVNAGARPPSPTRLCRLLI